MPKKRKAERRPKTSIGTIVEGITQVLQESGVTNLGHLIEATPYDPLQVRRGIKYLIDKHLVGIDTDTFSSKKTNVKLLTGNERAEKYEEMAASIRAKDQLPALQSACPEAEVGYDLEEGYTLDLRVSTATAKEMLATAKAIHKALQ